MIINDDCIVAMQELVEQGVQVDSIVTDPPYQIGFMGKDWDKSGVTNNVEVWKLCFQLLKPGGHLLSFGGARTYHRMTCAIEDAGFQIRDQIMWVFGSGFPKSLDISKAIDKRGGDDISWFGKFLMEERKRRGIKRKDLAIHFPSKTGGLTGCIDNWELGLGLPTPEQFNKLCEILNLPFTKIEEAERKIIGSSVVNLSPYRNIGDSNISGTINTTTAASNLAKKWQGWHTALKPAHEPILLARKPLSEATIATNVIKYGTGAINVDGCRVEAKDQDALTAKRESVKDCNAVGFKIDGCKTLSPNMTPGRFPANLIHDGSEEVMEEFAKYGERKSGGGNKNTGNREGIYGHLGKGNGDGIGGDTGTASRFYYCAKASKKERNGSKHPTVKPLALMRYLCRLVTPPGGTVLDPFAGTGTTGQAAIEEGFKVILIEKEKEYLADIEKRLSSLNESVANK
jgi:DNA modification methylase